MDAAEYRKKFHAVHVRRALLRLSIEQPKVILDKEAVILDTVVSIAKDYADALLALREADKELEKDG